MGLDFAIDELYATGWTGRDSNGCTYTGAGRIYPGLGRVMRDFADAGFDLSIRKADLFDCYRAVWHGGDGKAHGAVVGQSEQEAAVYALAQLRRSMAHASA